MAKVTIREWYRRVNEVWDGAGLEKASAPLTADEATRAARKLYRFIKRRTWTGPVKVTSGRRFSDIRDGTIFVNPDGYRPYRGWIGLVHDLSHDLLYAPHGKDHARVELKMAKVVVKRGWLDGVLKSPEKAPVTHADVVLTRRRMKLASIVTRQKLWDGKLRRAQTALKKLARERKRAEAALVKPIVETKHTD